MKRLNSLARRFNLAYRRLYRLPESTKGNNMAISDILATLDRQIAKLEQARALLGGGTIAAPKKKAGRPRKAVTGAKKAAAALTTAAKPAKKRKRNLSPEGRKRIAEAVKKRWAAKKAAEAK
jgi:hypothetical protein